MKRNMRGFTLAELLIVVAIIAVLVAIAIPVFTKQLEKSRESVDFSNMRSAYAEVMVAAINDDAGSPLRMADGKYQARITLKQRQEDWQTAGVENMKIGGVPYDKWNSKLPAVGGTATVTYSPDSDDVIIDWSGNGSGSGPVNNSESGPGLQGVSRDIPEELFNRRGVVIQDSTGTAVFVTSSNHDIYLEYTQQNLTVDEIANKHPGWVVKVDTKNIKTSSSALESLKEGDIYYDSANKSYHYVTMIDWETSQGNWPSSSWIELKQY